MSIWQKVSRLNYLRLTFFVLLLSSCSTTPNLREYALARTALKAAQDKDSPKYAPSYWHQAEELFRKGEESFKNDDFDEAEDYFIKSREFSEKAENFASVRKYKSGEVVP